MLAGHLASALVAKKQAPQMPWWMLMVAAFLLDIAMFTFVGLGIEQMEPAPGFDGPTMSSAIVEMTYSHDLLSPVFWLLLSGGLFFLLTRRGKFALVAMMLTFTHFLCDLVSGYGHFLLGPESQPIGTDWYHQNLLAAVTVEAILGVLCVAWFVRKSDLSTAARQGLFAGFGAVPFSLLVI